MTLKYVYGFNFYPYGHKNKLCKSVLYQNLLKNLMNQKQHNSYQSKIIESKKAYPQLVYEDVIIFFEISVCSCFQFVLKFILIQYKCVFLIFMGSTLTHSIFKSES